MARIAAQECAIWAAAGGDRFAACMRHPPRVDWTEDEQLSALGDAQLALIALDLTLEATRWLVANRVDANTALGDLAGELDIVWWIVRRRRDRIAHIKGWMADVGEGHILIERQALVVSGYPPFSFVTAMHWCAAVRGMLTALTWPYDDERPHIKPAKFDESDMPAWARSKMANWRPHRPAGTRDPRVPGA